MKHVADKYQNTDNIVIVGDFNYKTIDWSSHSCSDVNGKEFLKIIDDCYFTQLIEECTRHRGTQTPSILDLILTDNTYMIRDVQISSPIGGSDHSCVFFKVLLYGNR